MSNQSNSEVSIEAVEPHETLEPSSLARRDMFKIAGAGLATAALTSSGLARAQVPEEANTEPLMLKRKGINKDIRVFNIDLLEDEAKLKYGNGTYVFVSHGSGDQWTLRENRRAFGDYVFTPHRMQGVVREDIDTSVTLLGEKLPHPVLVTPFGSHGLHHPAGGSGNRRRCCPLWRLTDRFKRIHSQHGRHRQRLTRSKMVPNVPNRGCGPVT